jgi:hypothetical protein
VQAENDAAPLFAEHHGIPSAPVKAEEDGPSWVFVVRITSAHPRPLSELAQLFVKAKLCYAHVCIYAHATHAAALQTQLQKTDLLPCSLQMDDGSMNWGLLVFMVLAFGVLYIWLHFLCTLARLAKTHRRRKSRKCKSSCQVPLLAEWRGIVAPLAPEKPMAQKSAPDLFDTVEVRCIASCLK